MSRFEFFKSIWNKNWQGKATLIVGAVILVGAIVGIIAGLVQG